MGRRGRNRVAEPPPAGPRVKASRDEAPQAPWHPLPVTEGAILAGLVLFVAAFFVGQDARPVLLFGGLGIVSVAALELAIREHFAGYRSHTLLLAAMVGLAAAAPLWFTRLAQVWLIVVFVLVAAVAFRGLRATFTSRSGGLRWRA